MVQAGNSVASAATGTKPESKPTALIVAFWRSLQGAAKADCVTVDKVKDYDELDYCWEWVRTYLYGFLTGRHR